MEVAVKRIHNIEEDGFFNEETKEELEKERMGIENEIITMSKIRSNHFVTFYGAAVFFIFCLCFFMFFYLYFLFIYS